MMAIPVVLAFLCAVQDQPLGKLSGTVTDSVNGEPLGKVQVRATVTGAGVGERVSTTVTGSKGDFALVDLPTGAYRVQAVRNGYLDTAETSIALEAGEEIGGIEFKMRPYGVIAGTVRDPDGEPLSGATIVLLEQIYEYGRRAIRNSGYFENKTDDLGQFRIAGVKPGKYYVKAIDRKATEDNNEQRILADHSAKSDHAPTVVLPTYFPGVADAAAARLVEIAPGTRAIGIDIPVVRSPVFHVSVQTGGAPVARLDLSSNPEFEMLALHFRAAKNKEGDFEFPAVPAGLYTMTATGESASGFFSARQTALSVSRDMFTRIAVQPPARVTIHARVDGKPETKLPQLPVSLISASNRYVPMQRDDVVAFMPDPDHYNIYVELALPGLVIQSMRSGSTDVLRSGLTVSGASDLDVEIVFAAEGGTVDGVVLDADGKPASGATVLLIAAPELRGRYDSFHEFTADRHGRFHFQTIRPGEYKLFAWDDAEPNAWFDPEFLKKYEGQGEAVTLPASGHITSQLHLRQ